MPKSRAQTRRTAPIRTFDVRVTERIEETADTVTLVLETDDPIPEYDPGQFVTIDPHQFPGLDALIRTLEAQKGVREPARAYSLTSTPDEPGLVITIKEEPAPEGGYPPLLSPYLVRHVKPGDRMVVRGITGPYTLFPEALEAPSGTVVHLDAGSGIVPDFAILKWSLARDLPLRHVLLYSNKTLDDVIFLRAIDALAARHPDRLRVRHAITREPAAARVRPDVHPGRIDPGLLEEMVPDPRDAWFMICGPGITKWDRKAARARGEVPTPRFVETMRAYLDDLKVPARRIRMEAYG
jgi:3-ketosteroid 9alpha-monooxygenase subunit B